MHPQLLSGVGPAGCLGREAGVGMVHGVRTSAESQGWPWHLVLILSPHRHAWCDRDCSSPNICLPAGGRRGDSHIYTPAGSCWCRAEMCPLEQIPGGAWHSLSSACGDTQPVQITVLGPDCMQAAQPLCPCLLGIYLSPGESRAVEDCRGVALPQPQPLCPSQ